jgi:putative ABC transport system substrate-binding protein
MRRREFIGLLGSAFAAAPSITHGQRGLPMCATSRETFEDGALLSYAADQLEMCRHSAIYADKILKGAKPAELPVEQPTKLELLINLKTAKALGLKVPIHIQQIADEVIE